MCAPVSFAQFTPQCVHGVTPQAPTTGVTMRCDVVETDYTGVDLDRRSVHTLLHDLCALGPTLCAHIKAQCVHGVTPTCSTSLWRRPRSPQKCVHRLPATCSTSPVTLGCHTVASLPIGVTLDRLSVHTSRHHLCARWCMSPCMKQPCMKHVWTPWWPICMYQRVLSCSSLCMNQHIVFSMCINQCISV